MFDLPIGGDDADDPEDLDGPDGTGTEGTTRDPSADRNAGGDVAAGATATGLSDDRDGDRFDPPEAFVPESLPDPGPFLSAGDATVLTGEDHVSVRDTARELFGERGVRDATFGYVLTKLDRDRNHPDAGFRYARDGDLLRVEFTPTTGFCPQGGALATAAFRAWNADPDAHEFDHVAVRVSPSYHASESVNERLAEAEETLRETGRLPSGDGTEGGNGVAEGVTEP
ncbi:hypothetical protein [Halobaculum sp. EA56]|uniref:hypothetical protein n=1 Tax=Halobaculum sp. EA56 TaxID=3421648 RepID=UPI003EBF98F1